MVAYPNLRNKILTKIVEMQNLYSSALFLYLNYFIFWKQENWVASSVNWSFQNAVDCLQHF